MTIKNDKPARRPAASAGNAALRGALSDAFAFDPKSENLANLLRKVPALREIVPAYLATDPNDSDAENRLKNALVGVVPGLLVDGAMFAFRAHRARHLEENLAAMRKRADFVARQDHIDRMKAEVARLEAEAAA